MDVPKMTTPGARELWVPNARDDRSRRARIAITLGLSIALALFLVRQPVIAGFPGAAWSTALLLVAVVIAWRSGLIARTHAMLRLATIRRDGLEATQKLNGGDLAGAREAFAALLFTARPLGAFHAVHVLMYGVTRFFEGATKEGLVLATRAIDSGWFEVRQGREVRDAAETWRILMLLEAGELAEARRRVDAAPKKALVTAAIALSAYEKKWDAVLEQADAALADPEFVKAGRPTVAAIALHAAKKRGRDGGAWQRVLEAEPLSQLALKNPALKRFLPRAG